VVSRKGRCRRRFAKIGPHGLDHSGERVQRPPVHETANGDLVAERGDPLEQRQGLIPVSEMQLEGRMEESEEGGRAAEGLDPDLVRVLFQRRQDILGTKRKRSRLGDSAGP
jgi:hypothetical protein